MEDLLGSSLKIRLLRTLLKFPQKGFGIRELAAFLGVNHRSVAEAVKSFEQHNLVSVKVFGRSHAVYMNTGSYAYETVKQLLEKEQRTLPELIALLKQNLPRKEIDLCALFGSVAQSRESFNSDIDLLLITSHRQKSEEKIEYLKSLVLRHFGNPLHVIVFSRKEFNSVNPKLKENILKDHLLVYGKW